MARRAPRASLSAMHSKICRCVGMTRSNKPACSDTRVRTSAIRSRMESSSRISSGLYVVCAKRR